MVGEGYLPRTAGRCKGTARESQVVLIDLMIRSDRGRPRTVRSRGPRVRSPVRPPDRVRATGDAAPQARRRSSWRSDRASSCSHRDSPRCQPSRARSQPRRRPRPQGGRHHRACQGLLDRSRGSVGRPLHDHDVRTSTQIPTGTLAIYFGPVLEAAFVSSVVVLEVGDGDTADRLLQRRSRRELALGTCSFTGGSGSLAGFQCQSPRSRSMRTGAGTGTGSSDCTRATEVRSTPGTPGGTSVPKSLTARADSTR